MADQSRRVLLVTRYFPPLDSIATLRMYYWAKYLEQRGWRVSVLTTSKHGQVGTPLDLPVDKFDVSELAYFDPLAAMGVDKATFSMERSAERNWRRRLRHGAVRLYRERLNERLPGRTDPWILSARAELRRRREAGEAYDFVISSYGPPSAHVVGNIARKIFGAPWIADYRDLWVENHVYKGIWPFTLIEAALERRILPKASLVTTVSQGLADVLTAKFDVPVLIIENGFEPGAMDAASDSFFADHDPRSRIVYTGSIYKGLRDPSPVLAAIRQLIDEGNVVEREIEVLFFGASTGDLAELVAKFGLHNVVRHGGVLSQSDSYSAQKSADLLLFLEAFDPRVDGILTGKLFEYLYVGTPILAVGTSEDSEAGRLIKSAGAGTVCGTEVALIKESIRRTLRGAPSPIGDRSYISRFSRARQVDRLILAMEQLRTPEASRTDQSK